MKIAYLTGEFPRTTDVWIQREVDGLRAEGFEVQTFSVRRPDESHMVGPEQQAARAGTTYLLDRARSPRLLLAHLGLLARSPSRYLAALKLAWATGRPGLRGGLYQAVYFLEAGLLAATLRRRRIDHLHNHLGDSSCTVAMLASELSDIPYSFTLHGPGIFFEAHTWRLDEKLARAAFVSCISRFCRSQAAIFAPDHAERFHVVHCGVEPARLDPVHHRGVGRRIVFVGRIIRAKGVEVLLDAVESLRAEHEDLVVTVVGDGPDRPLLESMASRRGLAPMVDFVGAKSRDEVAKILGESDVFVLPSFAEGVPVVLMEAMGAGLPVIATYVGGMTELIEDETNGLLIQPLDDRQLADAIGRLLVDPELRRRLGRAGRRTVEDEFSSAREATRLGRLFRRSAQGLPSPVRPEIEN